MRVYVGVRYVEREYLRHVTHSPSGKLVCESSGPLDAAIVFVGESPAREEMAAVPPQPLIGRSGRLLTAACRAAGIDRSTCRIINCIPVRAPSDKFELHEPRDVTWGRQLFAAELRMLTQPKVVVTLGANPTEWMMGRLPVSRHRQRDSFISMWRGSALWLEYLEERAERTRKRTELGLSPHAPEDYLHKMQVDLSYLPDYPNQWKPPVAMLPTFHPAAILRQYTWHPWFMRDIAYAAKLAREGKPERKRRAWFFNQPEMLHELRGADVLSFDTEQEPEWIVGIASEEQVHTFKWDERARDVLTELLTARGIVKVAHNWAHDFAFFRKCLGITPRYRLYDSMGAAHTLNTALQKELSPHITTQFTDWAYYKWLDQDDPYHYNGMDAVACWDAYWPQVEALNRRGLMKIAEHDHRLLAPLLDMQAFGFRVDEVERFKVEKELYAQLDTARQELQHAVEPIVAARLSAFEKPHLFVASARCQCCGGGSKARHVCPRCAGYDGSTKPSRSDASARGFKTIKALVASFGDCRQCGGSGRTKVNLAFNPDSSDQLADLLYRGLRIKPRRFKGRETVKAAQLDPLRDRHPLIGKLVDFSKLTAETETVERLAAGQDGRLHCVFDPWGTASGRVAGKSGLLEAGTNPMNLPKLARRFVIPDDGHFFLYPDMQQIEARAVALYSGDENLKKALTEPIIFDSEVEARLQIGKPDYHLWIVMRMLERGVRISRAQSKRVSYAGFYGARPAQLAKELTAEAFRKGEGSTVNEQQATVILDTLFKILPGVKRWQSAVLLEVERTRRLRCPFTGRERTWTDYILDTKTKQMKYEIAKQVWSFLPQHLGAYVLALGLNSLYYESKQWGTLLRPLIHVHDALLMQAPLDRREEAVALAERTLTRDVFDMHFPCSMKTGANWYECSGD